MMVNVPCNLCGADHYKVLYNNPVREGDEDTLTGTYKITDHEINPVVRVVKCLRCGLVYANPRPDAKLVIDNYLDMVDEAYLAEAEGRRRAAREILKYLKRHRKSGKLLDVGCAAGFLLDEARKDGWEVYGVELSHWAAEYARNTLNLPNIFEGSLYRAGYPANSFDAVIMKDVIEHLSKPREVLEEIRHVLKPDGIICVNTPDIDSGVSRLLKARWWGIKQLHLYYFTRSTLNRMFEATGFHPVKTRSHARSFSLKYWFKNLAGYSPFFGRIYDVLKKHPRIGDRQTAINLGDQIEIFARKRRSLEYLPELEAAPEPGEAGPVKVVAVLPAYNAARTLRRTVADISRDVVDEIILVDDASSDDTVRIAREIGLTVFVHPENRGYGANQKTCYAKALEAGADIVVMVHPDYQYDPTVIPQMVEPISQGRADAVFGSRMMKNGALLGGMPMWKHNANIMLTALENVSFGTYLTEYHSGFRAYSAEYLRRVRFDANSDGFVFDTEIIAQGLMKMLRIEEVPIRTRYFDEASSIRFWPSVLYGLGILKTILKFQLHRLGLRFRQFQ